MHFLVLTLTIATPFILPAAVMLFFRIRGLRWPKRQRPFLRAALWFYGAALVCFAAHGFASGAGLFGFFEAFYGTAAEPSFWAMLGYGGQGLAALSLVMVINWDTVVYIREGLEKRRAMEQKAQRGAEADKPDETDAPQR